jgi:hypothetical protein
MVLRPNAPTLQATPTLVPFTQSAVPGQSTIFLQQAPQAGNLIANQTQVKVITPQGRMQMQQIQTPSGPKLIAVPIGQTLLPSGGNVQLTGGNVQLTPTFTATGQLQFQATPNIGLSSTPILANNSQAYTLQASQTNGGQPVIQTTYTTTVPRTSGYLQTSSGGITTVVSAIQGTLPVTSSNQIAGQSVIQSNNNIPHDAQLLQTPVSPNKRKKSKKKRRDPSDESPPKSGTVDLGALMKDVGLDIDYMDDGFGMDTDHVLVSSASTNDSSQNQSSLNTSQDSTSSSVSDSGSSIIGSIPSSIGGVPSIPQLSIGQLTTTIAPPQFVTSQLSAVGPQLSAVGSHLSAVAPQQIGAVGPQLNAVAPHLGAVAPQLSAVAPQLSAVSPQLGSVRLANPQIVTPQLTAPTVPGSSLQLVQGPDGQFILQTNPAPGIISQPVEVNTGATTTNPVQVQTRPESIGNAPSPSQKSSPRAPARPRPMPDPSRTPLFDDLTLPPGWHRKVSQRKSGASAGRYEVFIIGPTSKRFRSRNELKNFFEKTGETQLNPDDFDFSTFGRNNPKGPAPSIPTASASTIRQPNSLGTSVATGSVIVTTSPSTEATMPQVIQSPVPRSATAPSTITSLPAAAASAPTVSAQEYDLIKNLQRDLEVTGMASVAAAKALEGSSNQLPSPRNILLQNIQQPLPQASLTGPGMGSGLQPISLPTTPQQIMVKSTDPTTPSTASLEDADAQISLLLKTMQQQPGVKLIDEDKVTQFIESLAESTDTKPSYSNISGMRSPIPSPSSRLRTQSGSQSQSPGHTLPKSPVQAVVPSVRQPVVPMLRSPGPSNSRSPGPVMMRVQSPGPSRPIHRTSGTLSSEGVPSPSMPVLTPQVSLPSKPHDTSFQNTYLDSLSKSQISDPKKIRLRNSSGVGNIGSPGGNMPMLSPTTGILHSPSPLSDRGTGSPLPLSNPLVQSHITNKSSVIQSSGGSFGVIQPVHRTESHTGTVTSTTMTGPPNVTVQANVSQPNLGLGGAGSQIRALQHLPPNTRLVRGPNGQVTLQKIQTIELSQEMQQVTSIFYILILMKADCC